MNDFSKALGTSIGNYIELQHSLGYAFRKQASTLHAFLRYVEGGQVQGPLTQEIVLDFVRLRDATANCRAVRYGVLRRFAEYLAVYDSRTERLDPRALPRSRAIPPARILTDLELESLLLASDRLSPTRPLRVTPTYFSLRRRGFTSSETDCPKRIGNNRVGSEYARGTDRYRLAREGFLNFFSKGGSTNFRCRSETRVFEDEDEEEDDGDSQTLDYFMDR